MFRFISNAISYKLAWSFSSTRAKSLIISCENITVFDSLSVTPERIEQTYQLVKLTGSTCVATLCLNVF